jgi:hypothetical protein
VGEKNVELGTDKPFTKFDSEKPRTDLLPPNALLEVARVLGLGARKYAPYNAYKAPNYGRYSGAALRHLLQWMAGEDADSESGMNHLAHATCCLLFVLEMQKLGLSQDDRFRAPEQTEPWHGGLTEEEQATYFGPEGEDLTAPVFSGTLHDWETLKAERRAADLQAHVDLFNTGRGE